MKRLAFVMLALLLAACDEPLNVQRSALPGDPEGFRSEWSSAPPVLPLGQAFEIKIVELDRGFDTSTWEPCRREEKAESTDTRFLTVQRMTVETWLVIGVGVGPAELVVHCGDKEARWTIEVTGSRSR